MPMGCRCIGRRGARARDGHLLVRTCMASWVIRPADTFQPLTNLLREEQNGELYLQADETRINVL